MVEDSWIRRLRRDAELVDELPERLTFESPRGRVQVHAPGAPLQKRLWRLAREGQPAPSPGGRRQDAPGPHDDLLRELDSALLTRFCLRLGGLDIDLYPVRADFGTGPETPAGDAVLSPFAYARWLHDGVHLESPAASARVLLHGVGVGALLEALATPSALAASPPPGGVAALRRALAEVGLLVPVDPATGAPRQDDELAYWEPHELLFHTRTRWGLTDRAHGARTARLPSPPALAAPAGDRLIALPMPDAGSAEGPDRTAAIDAQVLHGPNLFRLLEARRSERRFGAEALGIDRLGALLYHTARVRGQFEVAGETLTARPYPSAGSRYPLEIYVAVERCDGLEAGLYRYRPEEHGLEPRRRADDLVREHVRDAWRSAGEQDLPQVVLTVAARFARTSAAYAGIAYGLVLKDAGVLLQTLHLGATAVGLASCILGVGDSELFARAAGTDWRVEGSVGEMILGSAAGAGSR